MVWFIDEYLDKTIREMKLCPGVNVNIDTPDVSGLYFHISIYWSSPRLNLNWYPIFHIDKNCETIFHSEGPENPDGWEDFVGKAADALAAALKKGE